ncbi:MAG: hypothetical protein Q7J14_00215 [Candidatus Magasanikbacteria bacterium]|nr:hypothetical protein [Candidatus Magasanikbacteria bacterium]
MPKKQTEEKSKNNLEKFAVFFEQRNAKQSARHLMWGGVILIFAGIIFFFAYATKLQISTFSWDQETIKTKNEMEKQWSESFANQEKEKNIGEIKKQLTAYLKEIVSSTVTTTISNTTTISTSTTLLPTSTILTTTTKK